MKRFTPHLRCLLLVLITIAFATRLVADPATKPAAPTPMDDPAMTSLAAYGKKMADAATNGNNAKLLDMMYAPVIDKAGGRDKLLAAMGARQRQLQDKGISIKSTTLGKADKIYTVGKTMYAVLPEAIVLTVPRGTKKSTGCLVGISQDKGKTWSFLDGKGGEDLIRDFLPDLPADVKIPERSEAVFTPDAK